jgi:hypothetical protein
MRTERRREPRAATDLTGRIVPRFGRPIGCVVRDRSTAGARLQVNSVFGVPDAFRLEIPATGEELHARVVWVAAGSLGVAID